MVALIVIALTIITFLAAGIFLFLRSLLTIRIDAHFGSTETGAVIRIDFWKKEVYCFQFDKAQLTKWVTELSETDQGQDPEKKNLQRIADWPRIVSELIRAVRHIFRQQKFRLSRAAWITEYGSGDAAQTAVFCGMIWSLQSMLRPFLADPAAARITVVPCFQERRFESTFSCMMTIRAGEAITVMLKIRRRQKEGVASGRSSDSRADENST